MATITLICSNNLIDRNRGRWTAAAIQAMPQAAIGRPATMDHEWDDVLETWGRITNARAYTTTPPADADQMSLDAIALEGYWECELTIEVLTKNQEVLSALDKILSENSIGFSYERMMCSNCTCDAKDARSYDCPNTIWDILATYYNRVGLLEIFEDSMVLIPANKWAVKVS
jgi:hypothetical protein